MEGSKVKRQAGQVVAAARDLHKVTGPEIIHSLINHFTELHGDRLGEDDPAIIGGIGLFHDLPVTVITTDRGQSAAERIAKHFGCLTPAGYRKSLRLIKQAAKFHRPIICLVNTPGAYPGQSAEEHGQGAAIAQNLLEISQVPTPIITIILGEGGSGGALALACGDQIWMLENSTYSILSPEGFASILWKDSSRADEAAAIMQLIPEDLLRKKVIDGIIEEPTDHAAVLSNIDKILQQEISHLQKLSTTDLLQQRHDRYRQF